jgi:hypothetical protein
MVKKITLALLLATAAQLSAATFTFATPPGAKDPLNDLISAYATFTVSGTTLTVTLGNNGPDPTGLGQTLADFSFQVAGVTAANISFSASSGTPVTIAANGTFTTGTTGSTGWKQTATAAGSNANIGLCNVSGQAGCASNGANSPHDNIISAPAPSSTYGSGFTADDPYIYRSATYTMTLAAGFPATSSSFSNVTFGFGTAAGNFSTASGSLTPEPGAIFILSGGVVLLALLHRRRSVRSSKSSR